MSSSISCTQGDSAGKTPGSMYHPVGGSVRLSRFTRCDQQQDARIAGRAHARPRRHCLTFRAVQATEVEALSQRLSEQRNKGGKKRKATADPEATLEWYAPPPLMLLPPLLYHLQHQSRICSASRDFTGSTGGGTKHEIDEFKAAEHFKLSAAKLDRLAWRYLSKEVCPCMPHPEVLADCGALLAKLPVTPCKSIAHRSMQFACRHPELWARRGGLYRSSSNMISFSW